VAEYVELELNLGLLRTRLDSMTIAITEAKDDALSGELQKRAGSLLATFEQISLSQYEQRVVDADYQGAFEAIRRTIGERFDVRSPASEERLANLVRLSIEFKEILGNPKANFTAFLARSSQVVAGTCVGIGRHSLGIVDHAYDWVIVDEAARSSSTDLAVAMQAGRRVLLVGDHKQLPPTYTPDFERELAKALGKRRLHAAELSDFARAFESAYGAACGRRLQAQYRMGHDIAELVSNCFYGGKLRTERAPVSPIYLEFPEFLAKQVTWVDCSDRGALAHESKQSGSDSYGNVVEADAVVAILRALSERPATLRKVAELGGVGAPIGVICMYAAQRDLVRRRLDQADWAGELRRMVQIGTVDSYQGKENRIVLVSLVRSNDGGQIGFLAHPERINVAISRAMDRLVIVGATHMWRERRGLPLFQVLSQVRSMQERGAAAIVPSTDIL
jgi:superfamily I DNA and/or RNA helicase